MELPNLSLKRGRKKGIYSSWLPSMGRWTQSYLTAYVVHVPKVPKSLILAMHFSEEHVVMLDVTKQKDGSCAEELSKSSRTGHFSFSRTWIATHVSVEKVVLRGCTDFRTEPGNPCRVVKSVFFSSEPLELPSSSLNLCFHGPLTVVWANSLCSWLLGLSEPKSSARYSKHMFF